LLPEELKLEEGSFDNGWCGGDGVGQWVVVQQWRCCEMRGGSDGRRVMKEADCAVGKKFIGLCPRDK
jgi:hypothetical protein